MQTSDPLASSPEERPSGNAVKVTFFGTSTMLIEDADTQLLVDGFLSRPPEREWLYKIETKKDVVDAALQSAGVDERRLLAVFVSHSHYDHALDVAYIAKRYPEAVLYGSPSTMRIGKGGDLKTMSANCGPNPERTKGLDMCQFAAGDTFSVGDFRIETLKSKHSPPAFFNDDLGKAILVDLKQPARYSRYKEGHSFDFMITHGKNTILVKPSANFVEKPLPHADVLFQGTGRMAKQIFDDDFMPNVFAHTVATVNPKLVVPIHWDDFFDRLEEPLQFPTIIDDSAKALEYLILRIDQLNAEPGRKEKIAFRMLQGFQSIMLFKAQDGLLAEPEEPADLNCAATPER